MLGGYLDGGQGVRAFILLIPGRTKIIPARHRSRVRPIRGAYSSSTVEIGGQNPLGCGRGVPFIGGLGTGRFGAP
jgi:hypothetical protein